MLVHFNYFQLIHLFLVNRSVHFIKLMQVELLSLRKVSYLMVSGRKYDYERLNQKKFFKFITLELFQDN